MLILSTEVVVVLFKWGVLTYFADNQTKIQTIRERTIVSQVQNVIQMPHL
jgi:hypothetical protein